MISKELAAIVDTVCPPEKEEEYVQVKTLFVFLQKMERAFWW